MHFFARFRTSEWIFLAYFAYVALLAWILGLAPETILRAWFVFAGAFAIFAILARPTFHIARDWIPLGLVLVAYREMDWFSTIYKSRSLERQWVLWDRTWLFDRGFREWIEVFGPLLPGTLEFTYLLVYGVGVFSVAAMYALGEQKRVGKFLTVYLIGTLASYSLFPYFPSDPPRVVFPGADMPHYLTALRRLNLALVGGYGIHSSVFPSAHVSSAFAAAWGLWHFLPERRAAGVIGVIYAALVAVATVYGRYHYGVDALAGIAISLIALAVALRIRVV